MLVMEACALIIQKNDVSTKVRGRRHVTFCKSIIVIRNRKRFLMTMLNPRKSRNSRLQMLFKIGISKNFANFAWFFCLFLIKLQVLFNKFSRELSQIFKNTFFYRTPPVATSGKGL